MPGSNDRALEKAKTIPADALILDLEDAVAPDAKAQARAKVCAAAGILPYYGPFGDIADVVAAEDQFRNAFLLGCVGTWTLHPAQIQIAKRVFSPAPADVAWARKVIAAMGDGTGAVMIEGKMQDDATVKQSKVVVDLADALMAIDADLALAYALAG
jgi:malyl-CoA/(S)-citramalyl-CoA lyase